MATEYLNPNGSGDETGLNTQYPTSGSHWDKVDDPVGSPDDDSTRVSSNSTTYQRDLYALSNPTGSGTINWIKVWYRFKRGTGGTGYLKPAIKTGGTAYEGTEDTETAGNYKNGSYQWTTNPKTGVAWTWDDLAALQAGISLKQSSSSYYAHCTQVYVEVDYTAVTPKTSSDAGSGVDAYVSLETPAAKSSSDTGSGAEGTPTHSAILSGSETGSAIDAFIARLLSAFDAGTGIEVGSLLKELFATELGWGSDSLIAKIEMPTKGGGMKLWT